METERKLRYMLEHIDKYNDLISKAEEAKKERNTLRKEVAKLMAIYVETLNEMS